MVETFLSRSHNNPPVSSIHPDSGINVSFLPAGNRTFQEANNLDNFACLQCLDAFQFMRSTCVYFCFHVIHNISVHWFHEFTTSTLTTTDLTRHMYYRLWLWFQSTTYMDSTRFYSVRRQSWRIAGGTAGEFQGLSSLRIDLNRWKRRQDIPIDRERASVPLFRL